MALTTSESRSSSPPRKTNHEPMIERGTVIVMIKSACNGWKDEFEKELNLPKTLNFDRTEHGMIFSSGSVFPSKLLASFEGGEMEDGFMLMIFDRANSTYLIISDKDRGILYREQVANLQTKKKYWNEVVSKIKELAGKDGIAIHDCMG